MDRSDGRSGDTNGQPEQGHLLHQLPRPLALAAAPVLEPESGPAGEVLRVFRFLDAVEVFARFLVAVGAGALESDSASQTESGEAAVEHLRLPDRPTLGDWFGSLDRLAGPRLAHIVARASIPGLGQAVEALRTLKNDVRLSPDDRPEGGILALRNWVYHAGGLTEATARGLGVRYGPLFEATVEVFSDVFATVALVRVDGDGRATLVPPGPQAAARDPSAALNPAIGSSVAGAEPGLYVCTEGSRVQIWPVFRHEQTGLLTSATLSASELVTQVFVRVEREEVRYAPYGHDAIYGRGGDNEVRAFRRRFEQGPDAEITDFWAEIQADAERFVGRTPEVDYVVDCLRTGRQAPIGPRAASLWWLWGKMGGGKSALAAAVALRLRQASTATSGPVVHVHRFRQGDPRCSLEAFVRIALEALPEAPNERKPDDLADPAKREDLLRQRLKAHRPTVVCDGLDELARAQQASDEYDPVRRLIQLALGGGVWLLTSRNERAVDALRRKDIRQVWPDGLPDMADHDLRTMLVTLAPPAVRDAILRRDADVIAPVSGARVTNRYVDLLIERSERSPLYLALILEWLGRLGRPAAVKAEISASLEDPVRVPTGINELYSELVHAWSTGDVSDLKTRALCLLACAAEPLSVNGLAELAYSSLATDQPEIDDRRRLARLVIDTFRPVLRLVRGGATGSPGGGFSLDHDSFRVFLANDEGHSRTWTEARRMLASAATSPQSRPSAAQHLFRKGIRYLLEDLRSSDAARLLCDFHYLHSRLAALGPQGIDALLADYAQLRRAGADDAQFRRAPDDEVGTTEAHDLAAWSNFMNHNAHLLRRASADWGPERILHQIAWDYATDSPVTTAAEAWSQQHGKPPMHRTDAWRAKRAVESSALLVTLGGHSVEGVRLLSDTRVLSWSKGGTLRVWDPDTGAELCRLEGHTATVTSVLEVADGRLISSSGDATVRIWDPSTGAELRRLDGHTGPIFGALALPDRRLVSWSDDATLRVWDAETGAELRRLEGHTAGVTGALALPAGRLVSWSSDATVRVWDTETGAELGRLDGRTPDAGRFLNGGTMDAIHGVLALRNGRLVAWSYEDTVHLWDPDARAELRRLEGHARIGWPKTTVEGVLALPDERLVSWSDDATVGVWDPETGAELCRLEGHTRAVAGALALPDGRLVSWSDDATVRVWDANTGAELRRLEGHTGGVLGVSALPNGRLVSWSQDTTVRVWDPESGGELRRLDGHTGWVSGALALPDGRLVSWSSSDATVRVWDPDAPTGRRTLESHTEVDGVLAMPDGRLISWSPDGTLRVWDASTGTELRRLEGHTIAPEGALAMPDGRLVSWSFDATVRIWDSDTGAELRRLEGYRIVGDVLALADGRFVFLSFDGTVRIWDPDTGAEPRRLDSFAYRQEGVLALADGRLVSWTYGTGGTKPRVRIWDPETGAELRRLDGFADHLYGVLALPDGRLVSWSNDAGGTNPTVRIWDPDTGAELRRLEGHTRMVYRVHALPDGRLVSWSYDATVRMWDPDTGAELRRLDAFAEPAGSLDGVLALPDDRVVCWSNAGAVRVWDAGLEKLQCCAHYDETFKAYPNWSWSPVVLGPSRLAWATTAPQPLVLEVLPT